VSLNRALIFLILLFAYVQGYTQSVNLLTDPSKYYRLDKNVEVYIDKSNSLDIKDVTNPTFSSQFSKRGNLTFGYLKDAIWIRVKSKSVRANSNWYLEIPAPFIEYVDFYQLNTNNQWDLTQAGYYRPQQLREVPHTGHVLPLVFNVDNVSTVYIRITGQSPKTFPIYILDKQSFIEKTRWEDLGYGIFFGILIVMFFFNFFIYIILRQHNYILYICTIVCTFLIFASASGYAGRFWWPETPEFNFYAGRLTLGLLTVFLSVFTIRFLNVKHYSTVMYYLLISLAILGPVSMLLMALDILSSAGNNLISLSIVVYLATGIVCRVKGNRVASFFIAAWTIYFIGGLLLTLRNSGLFDFNFWTTHFVEIGAALETIFIAFGLAYQYRVLKREKEEAQSMALKLQLETTEKLEEKVSERTNQLSKANTELQQALLQNQSQTKVIEEKNAELDAFFYRISHDLRGPVSSLLGLFNIAKMDVSDKTALDYFDKQSKQVERLDNVINGLINLTKLNADDIHKVPIDFNTLVDECINSFQSQPNFDGIRFTKDIQRVEFNSEWSLINAILQNLIENGIKYAGRNSPFVKIEIRQIGYQLIIQVSDNGQGIPTEHHARIFDMFYRATEHATGSGLGLYILKRSVDKLGGTISVTSEPGNGSTFKVTLPHQ
jgi:signal transduction histidine kinase